jgi:6-phosphogluconolactonase
MPALTVVEDARALAETAATEVVRLAGAAQDAGGVFSLVLSGGSTPVGLYRTLAVAPRREEIDWPRVEVFWGDERCVPPDHRESNFRMAEETLLSRVPVAPERVHRIRGEDEPRVAAAGYEEEIRAVLGSRPAFSLVLLGMGDDGHTASLFPGSPALQEEERLATAVETPAGQRITLTLAALREARSVVFLVGGTRKASVLARALAEPDGEVPASRVRPARGSVHWIVDRAAASGLPPEAHRPD